MTGPLVSKDICAIELKLGDWLRALDVKALDPRAMEPRKDTMQARADPGAHTVPGRPFFPKGENANRARP